MDGAVQLTVPSDVDALIELSRPIRRVFVVFDTLARCSIGADENSASDMSRVVQACDRIRAELDAHVFLNHHSRKDGATERGSSALRGAADTIFALAKSDDLLTLRCEKQKDGEEGAPLRLTLRPVGDTGSCVVSQKWISRSQVHSRNRNDKLYPRYGTCSPPKAQPRLSGRAPQDYLRLPFTVLANVCWSSQR